MSEPTSIDWRTVVAIGAAVTVIGVLLAMVRRRALPPLREAFASAARRRRESEAHAFRELEAALRRGSTQEAYQRLLEWTDRLEPPIDSREFADRYGDEGLVAGLENWHAALFGGRSGDGSLTTLAAGLTAARKRYREGPQTASPPRLPPLNPA